jgi:hypothetical protein
MAGDRTVTHGRIQLLTNAATGPRTQVHEGVEATPQLNQRRIYQILFRLTSLLNLFRYSSGDEYERATEGTAYNAGEDQAICRVVLLAWQSLAQNNRKFTEVR